MSNSVQVIGHLGNDPVTRVTAKGTKITTFSVATNSREGGEEVTIWWRITVWGDHYLLPHLRKGSAVFISGKIKKPELYDDKEGNKRISLPVTATDIEFIQLGRGDREQPGGATGQQQPAGFAPQGQTNYSSGGYSGSSGYPQKPAQRPYGSPPAAGEPSYASPAGRSAYGSQGGIDPLETENEEMPF